jgi:predicted ester cyclase
LSIEDVVVEKEKVAVAWTISGTHKGDFMGIPPANKRISVEGISIIHIADGKIMDTYVSWDALGVYQQLGAPPMGQAKDAAAR